MPPCLFWKSFLLARNATVFDGQKQLKGSMHSISMANLAAVVVVVVQVAAVLAAAQLRAHYYAGVCPNLEGIVRSSVKQSMAKSSPISAPASLRLFFHDCAVMGCDASVMIISPTGGDEWRNPDDYTVELGRFDGRKSTNGRVRMLHPGDNLDSLNAFFSTLGLSQTDMIALSGGHTLGAADCSFFMYRIVNNNPSMNSSFARQNFAFLDDVTPVGFDNAYYRNLQIGRGLLGSDQVLYTDQRSRGTVDFYAANQGTFFYDFSVAMTKLGRVGVKTAADGEIRRDCRYPN